MTFETSSCRTRLIDKRHESLSGVTGCEAVLVLEQFEHKPDRGPECQEVGGGEGGGERS